MTVKALVSTIIPVHNRAALVTDAVASVLAQSYQPLEVVVVDDGSNDETPAVLAGLQREHSRVRVCTQACSGPALARQAGLQLAQGEYIQYLDSDDWLLPQKFTLQVAALTARPDCDIAYGYSALQQGLSGEVIWWPYKGSGRLRHRLFPDMLSQRWWSTSTALFRRHLLDRAGPWADLSNEEDWEYDCRLAALSPRVVFVPAFGSVIRRHQGHQSDGGTTDPSKLRARALARVSILRSADYAGVPWWAPQRREFARYAFLLARQCGALGLSVEAEQLCRLAVRAEPRRRCLDVLAYRWLSRLVGHRLVAQLAHWRDRLRAHFRWAS